MRPDLDAILPTGKDRIVSVIVKLQPTRPASGPELPGIYWQPLPASSLGMQPSQGIMSPTSPRWAAIFPKIGLFTCLRVRHNTFYLNFVRCAKNYLKDWPEWLSDRLQFKDTTHFLLIQDQQVAEKGKRRLRTKTKHRVLHYYVWEMF
jgi:hypothetical protein